MKLLRRITKGPADSAVISGRFGAYDDGGAGGHGAGMMQEGQGMGAYGLPPTAAQPPTQGPVASGPGRDAPPSPERASDVQQQQEVVSGMPPVQDPTAAAEAVTPVKQTKEKKHKRKKERRPSTGDASVSAMADLGDLSAWPAADAQAWGGAVGGWGDAQSWGETWSGDYYAAGAAGGCASAGAGTGASAAAGGYEGGWGEGWSEQGGGVYSAPQAAGFACQGGYADPAYSQNPGSPGSQSCYDVGGYPSGGPSPASTAPGNRMGMGMGMCAAGGESAQAVRQREFDNVYGRSHPVSHPAAHGQFMGAYDDPAAKLAGMREASKLQAPQSADEWLNMLTKEAQESLSVESSNPEQMLQMLPSVPPRGAVSTGSLHAGRDGKVYSGPLSWIASPSAVTGYLGQSANRQSMNMVQQIASAEIVLRAELRYEVGRVREQLDVARMNAVQQDEEMLKIQATFDDLSQRLEDNQRRMSQVKQDLAAEDFRLAQTLEVARADRAEHHSRTLAAQVQLEQDALLLNRRLEAAMIERNEFMSKSTVLQARFEEEQRKAAVESAALSSRLVSMEKQVTVAGELANKQVLKESDVQTLKDAAAVIMPWAIEPKRLEKYEAAFRRADEDEDGFVSGAEARVVLDKTGLPQMELSHIWNLADADRDGKLTAGEFIVALHLAYKRSKEGIDLPPALPPEMRALLGEGMARKFPTVRSSKPAPDEDYATALWSASPPTQAPVQPEASGAAFAAGFAAGFAAVPPQDSSGAPTASSMPPSHVRSAALAALAAQGLDKSSSAVGGARHPQVGTLPAGIQAEEMQHYTQLFQNLDKRGVGIIGAQEGKDFFEQSGLETKELAHIWQISDRDGDGHLSLAEFACAMAIVTRRRNGEPLPQTAPSELVYQALAPTVGPDGGPGGNQELPDSASFAPSAEEIESYVSIFNTLDDDRDGLLGPMQAKAVMDRSELPDPELAQIWALSDTDADGNLNLIEFICALTLVDRRLKGLSVPPVLPPDLVVAANAVGKHSGLGAQVAADPMIPDQ